MYNFLLRNWIARKITREDIQITAVNNGWITAEQAEEIVNTPQEV